MRTRQHRLSRSKRISISPRLVRIGLVILGLILAIDLLAARFTTQIQSALTVPVQIKFAAPTHVAVPTSASTRLAVAPTQVPSAVPSPKNSVTLPPTGILAQDNFQRPDQAFWGITTGGQAWGADARASQSFAVVNHMGAVTNGSGVYDAILGPRATNVEVVLSGSLNHYATSSLGPVLRWTDANNLYKVFLGGGQLILLKKVAGVVTILKTVTFPAQDGTAYTFRFRATGSQLSARVWPANQPEPSNWMIMVTDNDLQSGYGGLRVVMQSGATANITSFMETSL